MEENITLDPFDQLISRVRNMLAYGMPTTEVYETLLNEGFSNDDVYFTIMAAKVLDKD
jgi:hypothetical protein